MINPAPTSVQAGHYYQGNLGQRFFARLRQARLLEYVEDGYEDDAAFASGIGFTDVVKRPTARADEVSCRGTPPWREPLSLQRRGHRSASADPALQGRRSSAGRSV
jgi:hypothetical protein